MSGEGAAIFFVFIKRFMLDCVCKKLEFATCTRTSPEWLRAPLSGSADFFSISFSFTAHANYIFAPRDFQIGLDKLVDAARLIVTETDYAERFLREGFPDSADRIHRIYNGLDLTPFKRADFSSTPPLIVAVGRLIAKKGFVD